MSVGGNAGQITLHCAFAGQLSIGGDLVGTLTVSELGNAGVVRVQGGVTGSGQVWVEHGCHGDLQIDGDVADAFPDLPRIRVGSPGYQDGTVWGHLRILGNVSDDLQIDQRIEAGGAVEIGGDINGNGRVWIGSEVLGTLDVAGNVGAAAETMVTRIRVGGDIGPAGDVVIGSGPTILNAGLLVGGGISPGGVLEIASDLGSAGQVRVAGTVAGRLALHGDVGAPHATNDPRIAVEGDICEGGDVTVGDADDSLGGGVQIGGQVDSGASLTIGGNVDLQGQVQVVSHVLGTVSIGGDIAPFGSAGGPRVTVGGDLGSAASAATLLIGGDLNGDVALVGSIAAQSVLQVDENVGGQIAVQGDCAGTIICGSQAGTGNLTGRVRIDGDLLGRLDIAGVIEDTAGDQTGGNVIVNGAFGAQASIQSAGGFAGTSEYIAIDYDGYDPNDRWRTGGLVTLAGVTSDENRPDRRVWEITACRGDMNNDGVVGFADINGFVDGLTDPERYRATYPGLDGSMDWHGDCNTDVHGFGFDDINDFVVRVTTGCCDPNYPGCPEGEALNASPTPAQLAAILTRNVTPDRYRALVFVVGQATADYADTPLAGYWQAVYAQLRK